MQRYIMTRVLLALLTLWGVTLLVFFMVYVGGGDPVSTLCGLECSEERVAFIREQYNLDDPVIVQYGSWLGGVLQGDFGESIFTQQAVATQLRDKFPPTVQMGLMGLVIGVVIAIPAGIIAAVKQKTLPDYVFRGFAIAFAAIPNFWIGLVFIGLGAQHGFWTPEIFYSHLWEDPATNLDMMLPPAILLGTTVAGVMLRLMRTEMLEVWRNDYIRTGFAKGLPTRTVIVRHALRNALIPVVTLIGSLVPLVIGGAVIMESVFNVPGIGRYLLDGVKQGDLPAVQGVIVIFASAVLLTNLVVDLLYPLVDPRVSVR